jgi:hypothetical protein
MTAARYPIITPLPQLPRFHIESQHPVLLLHAILQIVIRSCMQFVIAPGATSSDQLWRRSNPVVELFECEFRAFNRLMSHTANIYPKRVPLRM